MSWESVCQGCLCPRGSLSREGLCTGRVSVRGVSAQGGCLCRGVSIRETPLTEITPYGNERVVRILLEFILALLKFHYSGVYC